MARRPDGGMEISATRAAHDIAPQPPFVVVTVLPAGNGSRVSVQEGDYGCSASDNCDGLGLTQDVQRDLDGQTSEHARSR